jgi:mannitol-1-phosphate 5-dehydrogenase
MRAVHFGAGNIGRGFIGALLQDAGYHVVFADVNQDLLDQMSAAGEYELIEVGEGGRRVTYSNFSCVNSVTQQDALVKEIAGADIVTASVGATILPRIAGTIALGIDARESAKPLIVMACENSINASDTLLTEVLGHTAKASSAIFANTAVDRIVPIQSGDIAPSVEVEAFSELVIETKNLGDYEIDIPGATMVPDLAPYIERKLYTVNTAHCATAYLGQRAGYESIAQALANEKIHAQVLAALTETSRALVLKHGLSESKQDAYVSKTMYRLQNPLIDDSVERVGRDPIRKLSRTERLIGPAAYLAEQGIEPSALLDVVAAALVFHNPEDPTVATLQEKLTTLSTGEFVEQLCGISASHPLHSPLCAVVDAAQSR